MKVKQKRNRRLSQQQIEFAKYYNIYQVGATAAKKAGYACPYTQAVKLMKNPKIVKLIEEERAKTLAKIDIEANEIIETYANLATSDIDDYYNYSYELRYTRIDQEQQTKKQKERLAKYLGYNISVERYESLTPKQQMYYKKIQELKPFNELTKAQRMAIQGVTYDRKGNAILKLSNKETSLDALSKIQGLYEKDNKQKQLTTAVLTLDDFYNK